jgi:pimeloyl-ACP methyl ester carboxylesterase
MSATSFIHSAGGIDWYCETQGSGPAVVLVPSGEGDCSSFSATMERLAERFSVLTFDAPGFSRTSAPADPSQISMNTLARDIVTLVGSLGIDRATFYGCSSGGRAVLDLTREHPTLVRNSIVHEVALPGRGIEVIEALVSLDDAGVRRACKQVFATVLNEDQALWEAQGDAYHRRLERNYITWVRRYLAPGLGGPIDPTTLADRPITWTVGDLTPPESLVTNFELAKAARIPLGNLPCRHFPQVSIPDKLAAHIADSTARQLA